MKKLPVITMVRGLTVMRGVLTIMLLLCLFPWNNIVYPMVRNTTGLVFVAASGVELWLAFRIRQQRVENPDERDLMLLARASDTAITYNMIILTVLTLLLLIARTLIDTIPVRGYMLGFVGVNLPLFIKYCLYLYYERTDEGEYYE